MNRYFVPALLLLLTGCVEHPDTTAFNIPGIEQAVKSLDIESEEVVVIPKEELPETLKEINPEEVRGTKFGTFIILQSSFNNESGLFVSSYFGSMTSFGGVDGGNGFPGEFKKVESHTFTFKRT